MSWGTLEYTEDLARNDNFYELRADQIPMHHHIYDALGIIHKFTAMSDDLLLQTILSEPD